MSVVLSHQVTIAGIPMHSFYFILIAAGAMLLVAILGIIGAILDSKICTVIDLLITCCLLIVGIVIILHTNGISTIKEIDTATGELQDLVEKNLFTSAVSDSVAWNSTQKILGCCGVDVNATYAKYSDYNVTSLQQFVELLQPGEACAEARAAILAYHTAYPNNPQEFTEAKAAVDKQLCKASILQFYRANSLAIGAIAIVLATLRLVCSIGVMILSRR